MRFMIIGHSAREHAIARRLVQDGHEVIAYATRKNIGLDSECRDFIFADTYVPQNIVKAALKYGVDLLLPTDENALFAGVCDAAIKSNVRCLGHTMEVAILIEGKRNEVVAAIDQSRYVRRPDGITASTLGEVLSFLKEKSLIAVKPLMLDVNSKKRGVLFLDSTEVTTWQDNLPAWVENYAKGKDFSVHYLVHGNLFYFLGMTLDFPFLNNQSKVLTGGMASITQSASEHVFVPEKLLNECKKVTELCVRTLQQRHKCTMNGFVSAQFRKIRQQAIFVELDSKPGNPEILALLPNIQGDFGSLLWDVYHNKARDVLIGSHSSTAISMAPSEYPSSSTINHSIPREVLTKENVFCGETERIGNVITSGKSRTLCVVRSGKDSQQTVSEAIELASQIAKRTGLIFRSDIKQAITSNDASSRVRKSISELKRRGGKRIMLRLSPEANEALKFLVQKNGKKTETSVINEAIISHAKQ